MNVCVAHARFFHLAARAAAVACRFCSAVFPFHRTAWPRFDISLADILMGMSSFYVAAQMGKRKLWFVGIIL